MAALCFSLVFAVALQVPAPAPQSQPANMEAAPLPEAPPEEPEPAVPADAVAPDQLPAQEPGLQDHFLDDIPALDNKGAEDLEDLEDPPVVTPPAADDGLSVFRTATESMAMAGGEAAALPVGVLLAFVPGQLCMALLGGWGTAMALVAMGALGGAQMQDIVGLCGGVVFVFSFVPVLGILGALLCGGPGVLASMFATVLAPLPMGAALGAMWGRVATGRKDPVAAGLKRGTVAAAAYWPLAALVALAGFASASCWGMGSAGMLAWILDYTGDRETGGERAARWGAYRNVAPLFLAGGAALSLLTVALAVGGLMLGLPHLLVPFGPALWAAYQAPAEGAAPPANADADNAGGP